VGAWLKSMRFAARHLVALVLATTAGFSVQPGAAGADTAVIVGRVFDASVGPDAGIHFALVELHIPGADGGVTSATTDVDGSFAITLPPGDDANVFVSVSAVGYYPFNHWSSGPALRQSPLAIGLEPAPSRVDTAIAGLVYDASKGRGAAIAGAAIDYIYYSYNEAFPEVEGHLLTGPDGRYAFEQPLGENDYFGFNVSAPGFAPFVGYVGASEVVGGTPRDFGLAPLGGVVRIDPHEMHIDCSGTFTVTITNVGPDNETLVILGIGLYFHYGEGVYGTAFTADLSAVQFPVLLAAGEQLSFPMTFSAGGEFPTLLDLNVISGAPDGGDVDYYGGFQPCGGTCAGDCDGSGSVTVDELVHGVAIALERAGIASCASLDTDGDALVSIGELVAAVDRALGGCSS